MGVSLKTEQRRSHIAVSSFRPWVRRAEGYRGTRHLQSCRQVPGKPRRPPSLRLICIVFPAYSSFSVFRETPMAFFCDYFKKLNCYNFLKKVCLGYAEQPRARHRQEGPGGLRSVLYGKTYPESCGQSALKPEALMIGVQRSRSFFRMAENSSGVVPTASLPRPSIFPTTSGDLTALTMGRRPSASWPGRRWRSSPRPRFRGIPLP